MTVAYPWPSLVRVPLPGQVAVGALRPDAAAAVPGRHAADRLDDAEAVPTLGNQRYERVRGRSSSAASHLTRDGSAAPAGHFGLRSGGWG
ncbi:hypothetical protein ABZ208_24630 [Streptomyces sp. NPDC006208]|uniref:hypothetical protein n=1 Tax=Streptomyces sp. NPDC006208 TaxID=3156734 RepID=UPI0033B489BA